MERSQKTGDKSLIINHKVNPDNSRFGFQGEFAEEDEETGFNHFELRQYDAVIGRWLSVDPMGQYASPYLGMGNNPVNRIDPDGGFDEYTVNLSTGEVTWISDLGGDDVDFFHVVTNHQNGALSVVETFALGKNDFGLVSFPQTGDNWGRYGARDAGGDNWASPQTAGAFLGLLYDYGRDFPNDRIYYDDISASDGRDIGHTYHRTGDDIDIRYLGADNGPSEGTDANCRTCWNTLRDAQGFPFRATNVNFTQRAGRWGFNANYAYPQNFPNTLNQSHYTHRHHLHLGR